MKKIITLNFKHMTKLTGGSILALLVALVPIALYAMTSKNFNDPLFGDNVYVFDDSMDMKTIQSQVDAIHKQQRNQRFSSERIALLFKPGEYDLDLTIDFYVQASGLGRVPGDVKIKGAVQSITTTKPNKVTTQFWRSAENFEVTPRNNKTIYWAVSQAAPYRRMHVKGNIHFDKHDWASGGFLGNSIIEGKAGLDTGQQWFTRNSEIGAWYGANWNKVFVGVEGAPKDLWPQKPYTTVDRTPRVREKPFLTYDPKKGYAVFVPEVMENSRGVTWDKNEEKGESIPLDKFHIAFPEKDTAESISKAIDSGKNILLTPGNYLIDSAIQVKRPNTIILGLGFATFTPQKGKAVIVAEDVEGLKFAGFMVDAGPEYSPSLIQIGTSKTKKSHHHNPSSLSDVFCRVGGPAPGAAESCLTINSNDVIADHLWLWRADHGSGAEWEVNKSKHGLVVNGDNVTVYGLFSEHFQHYQTLWNGEYGRTYFYQSEIPYDPPNLKVWNDNGKAGFASYKVADHVQNHQAWGLGIYSFFKKELQIGTKGTNEVRLENSVEAPCNPGIKFTHIVNFAGLNGGINHVINGLGDSTDVGEHTQFDGFTGTN